MISKISVQDKPNICPQQKEKNLSFKGSIVDALVGGVQYCEKYPMLNVSVLDVTTAIAPRTYIETKTNNHAGFEAFRRESSGLFVNCLIPSFIVLGVAKLLEQPIMGQFKNSKMGQCWANEETMKIISQHYIGSSEKELDKCIKSILSDIKGVDGKETVNFAEKDLSRGVRELRQATIDNIKGRKRANKLAQKAFHHITESTHTSENIKIAGKASSENLEGLCRDIPKDLSAFAKEGVEKNPQLMDKFLKSSRKLINTKSLIGLGIVIPLACSMQKINRWITHKESGQKGAPIYKSFGKQNVVRSEDKANFGHKLVAAASMVGVAILSMGGKFSKFKNMNVWQFKGLFPTMDQARIISTATFAGRMFASEDKNDLREATIRDIATFSGLYFLGDYAAKGTASLLEKYVKEKDGSAVKLVNNLNQLKNGANRTEKILHWIKNTAIKSSDEVATPLAKNMRSVCQLANIGFSLALLGIFIPLYTRHTTAKKEAQELKRQEQDNKNNIQNTVVKSSHKTTSSCQTFGDLESGMSASAKKTYNEFLTAK